MPALLLLLACAGNIQALYDAEKNAVLCDPAAAGKDWQPELRLRISDQALEGASGAAIDAGLLDYDQVLKLDNPLGVEVTIHPSAKVTDLGIQVGEDCEACLNLDTNIEGVARWTAANLDGKLPFEARLQSTIDFELVEKGEQRWALTGKLSKVSKLEVKVKGQAAKIDLDKHLEKWTSKAIERVPDLQLGEIGGDDLPLRALRLRTGAGALEVQGLLDVAGGSPVDASNARPRSDWELRIHQDTALAMMRRVAFEAGTIDHDVAIDPHQLQVSGSDFTLGLRLWRLAGRGWWREYSVKGQMSLDKGKLKFRSSEAEEGEKSKGAGLADPLALLAEGMILDAVAEGVNQAVPARKGAKLTGMYVEVEATKAAGQGTALVLTGNLVAKPAGSTGGERASGQKKLQPLQ